jgi:hypothetical protein
LTLVLGGIRWVLNTRINGAVVVIVTHVGTIAGGVVGARDTRCLVVKNDFSSWVCARVVSASGLLRDGN